MAIVMKRERAIEIINEAHNAISDDGMMDAAVGWCNMTDSEISEEADLIMIERIKAVARYCGSELTDEQAAEEWEATKRAEVER